VANHAFREVAARSIYENFVGGAWTPSASGRLFENRNPADNDDLIGVFQESTPDDGGTGAGGGSARVRRLAPGAGARRAEMLFAPRSSLPNARNISRAT